ncbi:O-antigen ligase family protein [Rhodocyclus tenuis]|uniref:O-antigen ligase family protein n=1 Tax=Rhodocyclus gracilis TaxID=2929842 RepID=A0ABX0WJT9_9RHOO|nr:O-antigen ligase family protein [Rhodocyclus gracilis]NJA89982.1 O-antigen ligase family protein [Rhodocyclus gracilis]
MNFTKTRFRSVGFITWLALIFLQPFNQFGALRLIGLATLLLCLSVELWRNPRLKANPTALTASGALVVWILISSFSGPYPIESLQSLRKEFLPQLLLFIGALLYVREYADARKAIFAAAGGFALLTLLSAGEILSFWQKNGFAIWIERSHDSFWGGYASTASFYIPLLLALLLTHTHDRGPRLFGWSCLVLATILTFLYGSRTPFPVIFASSLVLIFALNHKRGAVLLAVVVGGFILFTQQFSMGPLEKYKTLASGSTYVTNAGLSQRISVWEGCMDVIQERPIAGYGFGWKKLAWAINDGKFAARWESRPDISAYYLTEGKASYGRVNPHNYILQVAFEIGITGILLVAYFWAIILREGIWLIRNSQHDQKGWAICIVTALFAYGGCNLTNGHWVGGLANTAVMLAGCLLALAYSTRKPPSLIQHEPAIAPL